MICCVVQKDVCALIFAREFSSLFFIHHLLPVSSHLCVLHSYSLWFIFRWLVRPFAPPGAKVNCLLTLPPFMDAACSPSWQALAVKLVLRFMQNFWHTHTHTQTETQKNGGGKKLALTLQNEQSKTNKVRHNGHLLYTVNERQQV